MCIVALALSVFVFMRPRCVTLRGCVCGVWWASSPDRLLPISFPVALRLRETTMSHQWHGRQAHELQRQSRPLPRNSLHAKKKKTISKIVKKLPCVWKVPRSLEILSLGSDTSVVWVSTSILITRSNFGKHHISDTFSKAVLTDKHYVSCNLGSVKKTKKQNLLCISCVVFCSLMAFLKISGR